MTDGNDQHDLLEEIFRKSLEVLHGIQRQPVPASMETPPPFESMLHDAGPGQMRDRPQPGLLHGLVDDATLKPWLIHEIQLLRDLIADDDRSITRTQERLESFVFRRDRLAKLRKAFEILRDDIVATEG